jgi:gluconate 5-dehydrogenase
MHALKLFDLKGKIALVTEGSRGIGLEAAIALGEAGAAVAITARREGWLQQAADVMRDCQIKFLTHSCDATQLAQVQETVTTVLKQFGKIDILLNNAGLSWGTPAEMTPLEKWRAMLEQNVTGYFLMAQAAAKEMIRRDAGGKIVNIAPMAGIAGSSAEILDAIGYSTGKGAVLSMTRELACKWAPHRITVNAIVPGFFPPRTTTGAQEKVLPQIESVIPMGRIGHPGELKGLALFLASSASDYVTGQVIAIDGGLAIRRNSATPRA